MTRAADDRFSTPGGDGRFIGPSTEAITLSAKTRNPRRLTWLP